MNEFAAMMKNAEALTPNATIQMQARWTSSRQPAPAEDPQSEERRLEEEGDQAFERQWRAEDVADEAGVLAPVHAELEFLHDAGGDADREVDQEQLAEELGQPVPARSLPVMTQAVCITAMSGASPMVSGTKMKW